METVYIGLAAGPGCGKSTTAALLFGKMKVAGYQTEQALEYAKDLYWEKREKVARLQPYISIKQLCRQYRLLGEVEFVVTDSPLILSLAYISPKAFGCTPSFAPYLLETFNLFNNRIYFLERNIEVHPYVQAGRYQTLEKAIEKDQQILSLLEENGIPYKKVPVLPGDQTAELILDDVTAEYGRLLER